VTNVLGHREDKQAKLNADRAAEAAQWAEAGHTVYTYLAKISATWNGGMLPEMALEIEAIESAGWRLDQATLTGGTVVLFVFHRA
jgi:hypothetical protein